MEDSSGRTLPRNLDLASSPCWAGQPRVLTSYDQLLAKWKNPGRCLSWCNQAAVQFISQFPCVFCLIHTYWSRPFMLMMSETIFAHQMTCTKAMNIVIFILWLNSPGLRKGYLLGQQEIQLFLLRWVAVVLKRSWQREQPTLCGKAGQAWLKKYHNLGLHFWCRLWGHSFGGGNHGEGAVCSDTAGISSTYSKNLGTEEKQCKFWAGQ